MSCDGWKWGQIKGQSETWTSHQANGACECECALVFDPDLHSARQGVTFGMKRCPTWSSWSPTPQSCTATPSTSSTGLWSLTSLRCVRVRDKSVQDLEGPFCSDILPRKDPEFLKTFKVYPWSSGSLRDQVWSTGFASLILKAAVKFLITVMLQKQEEKSCVFKFRIILQPKKSGSA